MTADQALAWLGGATQHLAGSALAVSDVRTELDRLRAIEARAIELRDDPGPNNWRGSAVYILTGEG